MKRSQPKNSRSPRAPRLPEPVLPLTLLLAASLPAWAAEVDLAQGKVNVSQGAELGAEQSLLTGAGSKVQLDTDRGIVRAGSGTSLSVGSDGSSVDLQEGVMLVSSDRGRFLRSASKVNTESHNISAKGTALVAYQPDEFLKVTCVEGIVTVGIKGIVLGEKVSLRPGQMLITKPGDKRLPDAVDVDLQRLVETSALLGGVFGALDADDLIGGALASQQGAYDSGDASLTALLLPGAGGELQLLSDATFQAPAPEPVVEVPPAPAPASASQQSSFSPPPPPQPQEPFFVPEETTGPLDDGSSTNPGYVVQSNSSYSPGSLDTPGFDSLMGVIDSGEGGQVLTYSTPSPLPSGTGNDAALSIRGETSVPSILSPTGSPVSQVVFATEGSLDLSGTSFDSVVSIGLQGRDVGVQADTVNIDGNLSVLSGDGGILNVNGTLAVQGNASFTSENTTVPSPDPESGWLPYPTFPVDFTDANVHVAGDLSIMATGPGHSIDIFSSQIGTPGEMGGAADGIPSAASINISADTTDVDASANSSLSQAIRLTSGSSLGGPNTGSITIMAANGSIESDATYNATLEESEEPSLTDGFVALRAPMGNVTTSGDITGINVGLQDTATTGSLDVTGGTITAKYSIQMGDPGSPGDPNSPTTGAISLAGASFVITDTYSNGGGPYSPQGGFDVVTSGAISLSGVTVTNPNFSRVVQVEESGVFRGITITDTSLSGRSVSILQAVPPSGSDSEYSGSGISVTGSTLDGSGTVGIWSPNSVTVDSSQITAQGYLDVSSNPSPGAATITITNSSQLRAITEGLRTGQISIQGGNININGNSVLHADDLLTIDAGSETKGIMGTATIQDATLMADVIKARGYATGGDSLIIDSSTLTAATMMKLYAEGTSNLRFRGAVSLNTPQADLAGSTVVVDPGGAVTATGDVNVYSDSHLYNMMGHGTISDGAEGVNQSPFASRPSY